MAEKFSTKSGREAHSLVEPSFLYGLGLVRRMLEGKEIRHAVYGGAGAQIYIAAAVAGDEPIDTVDSLSRLTRATSDYDIAIPMDVDDDKLAAAVHAYVRKYISGDKIFEEISGDCIFQTRLERDGSRRPVLAISGLNTNESNECEESKIHVTFDKDKPHHTEMALSSKTIELKHSLIGKVAVNVAPIEYIVAGKLGRGNPKDIADSFRLASYYPSIDLKAVKTIAERMSENEKHDKTDFFEYLDSRVNDGQPLLGFLKRRLDALGL